MDREAAVNRSLKMIMEASEGEAEAVRLIGRLIEVSKRAGELHAPDDDDLYPLIAATSWDTCPPRIAKRLTREQFDVVLCMGYDLGRARVLEDS